MVYVLSAKRHSKARLDAVRWTHLLEGVPSEQAWPASLTFKPGEIETIAGTSRHKPCRHQTQRPSAEEIDDSFSGT